MRFYFSIIYGEGEKKKDILQGLNFLGAYFGGVQTLIFHTFFAFRYLKKRLW